LTIINNIPLKVNIKNEFLKTESKAIHPRPHWSRLSGLIFGKKIKKRPMIKNIKNRIRRLIDVRVIVLKNLSNGIEKEMRKVTQIRYNIKTDKFSNKKVWFVVCSLLKTAFSSIVSLVLAFLMSFLFNNMFLEDSQFPYVFGAFSVFFVLFFLAFNALFDDLIFSKKSEFRSIKNDQT
jgi:hypothetical protein